MKKQEEWTEVISPSRGWFDLRFRELWKYRDLVVMFLRRDFVAVYKQTILGPLWHFIRPIVTTVLFTVVFGTIAGIPTDGIPPFVFYLSGLLCWNHFAKCVSSTSNTFQANAGIFGKVYFPRMVVPISTVLSAFLQFFIQFILFFGFWIYYLEGLQPNWQAMLLLPLLLVLMSVLGLGVGILTSALTTKYRDLQILIEFGLSLLMYMTPVIYPVSMLGEKYRLLMTFNPMGAVIETFRYAFLGKGILDWTQLGIAAVLSVVIFFLGLIIFNKIEKDFMDTI